MALASEYRMHIKRDSTAQLKTTGLEQHMSALGGTGLIGAGSHGLGINYTKNSAGLRTGVAKSSVPMSAAVLEAAKRVAEELQNLQDEYLTSHYSGDKPPPQSRFIAQSWGQMSVLNTLMEQMEDEKKAEAAIKRRAPWRGLHANAEALAEEAEDSLLRSSSLDKDWRKILKQNQSSASADAARRAEKQDKREAAATIIQKCWKQHRFIQMVAKTAKRNREARKKSTAMYNTTETYQDHNLHGSKLKFMPTGMVKGFRDQEVRRKRASLAEEVEELMPGAQPIDPLEPRSGSNTLNNLAPLSRNSPDPGKKSTVASSRAGEKNQKTKDRPVHGRAEPLSRVALENSRSKNNSPEPLARVPFPTTGNSKRNTPEPLDKIPSSPTPPADEPRGVFITKRKSMERNYMKHKYKMAPLPLASTPSPVPPQDLSANTHSPSPLPFLSRSPSPWESADDSSKVLSIGMVKKTGLWRKVRAPVSLAGAIKQEKCPAAEVAPTSLDPANGNRWKSVVYRANRINAVAASFLEFDKALAKWTQENEGVLGTTTEKDVAQAAPDTTDGRALQEEAAQAGQFLVAASAMWRIMRSNLLHAKEDILAPSTGDKSRSIASDSKDKPVVPKTSIPALEGVASLSTEQRTEVHHHLGKEIQPISVALGHVHQPLKMIQRSLRQAKRARARVQEKAALRADAVDDAASQKAQKKQTTLPSISKA